MALCLALVASVLSGSGQAQQPPPDSHSGVPEVLIQAQREALEKQAREFVGKVSGSSWADEHDKPLPLGRKAICPAVAGLPRNQGEFIFNRLTDIISVAGAHSGLNGC